MSAQQAQSGAPQLTVALIVRNEEATLSDTLESVRHVAQEIVVVDTGSIDRTREIARQHGARVIEHVWDDDFSAARNAAWSAVRGTWVLWIDAGERLTPESASSLQSFIHRGAPADRAYLLMVEVPPREADGYAEQAARLRLVPHRPGLCYAGRVRESLDESLRQLGLPIELGPWRLRRGPREHDPERKRQRAVRDLRLLEREIQQHGPLPHLLVALGDLHNNIDERTTAAAYFRKAIEGAARGSRAMLEAYYGLLTALDERQADQREARLTACVEGLEIYPFDAQLLCAMGSYLQTQGRLDLATRSYQTAHQFGQIQPETWHVPAMGEVAAVCLSLTLQLSDREPEARQAVEEYLAKHPHSIRARRRLIELLVRAGDEARALAQIDELPPETPQRAALRSAVRGAVQGSRQNWSSAVAYLQTALDAGCRDPLCLRWLAVAQISLGDLAAAETTLGMWQEIDPKNGEIAKYRDALRPVLDDTPTSQFGTSAGSFGAAPTPGTSGIFDAAAGSWSQPAAGEPRAAHASTSPAVIQELCESMLGHGLVDDALQLSSKMTGAASPAPGFAEFLTGLALRRQGHDQLALRQFEASRRAAYDQPWLYEHWIDALLATDQAAAAQSLLAEASSRWPDHVGLVDRRRKLDAAPHRRLDTPRSSHQSASPHLDADAHPLGSPGLQGPQR